MEIDRSKIRLVDGFKIRNTLDDDFAIFHLTPHHAYVYRYAPKFYIPKGESWFDIQFQDEFDFIVRTEELSESLIHDEKLSYAQSRERLKQELCKKEPIPEFKLDKEDRGEYSIIRVDGKTVREYIDPEFVFGGHEFVYDYVPKGEIWIDARMNPAERPYIELHETVERELMKNGKAYDPAHDFATVADKELRRDNGVGAYPGEPNYLFWGMTDDEVAKQYYVDERNNS